MLTPSVYWLLSVLTPARDTFTGHLTKKAAHWTGRREEQEAAMRTKTGEVGNDSLLHCPLGSFHCSFLINMA
jgi:hypothetical protein